MKELIEAIEQFNNGTLKLKSGTLRFWGDWFGRPMDNFHIVNKLQFDKEESALEVYFEDGGLLRIWNPKSYMLGKSEFNITSADRVRWEWYSYGDPRVSEQHYYLDYVLHDSKVEVTSGRNGSEFSKRKIINNINDYAVEIC